MKDTNLNYKLAAEECANYIFNSDSEHINYEDFIQQGNDPREHILYYAAIILGEVDQFQTDIEEYEQPNKELDEWEK
jgi:hypothetical protein